MKRILNKLFPVALAMMTLLVLSVFAKADAEGAYALMNIPYAEFYAAEVTDASGLDTVTSSTLMKPRTGALAGGSYHVDPAGTDITGVIFPVRVDDAEALTALGGKEITDESSVSITVTNKGKESTTVYEGKDALFEAPSYSWYALAETPAQFKVLTLADGKPVFSAVNTAAETVGVTAALRYDKHADQAIVLDGVADVMGDQQVSGIILTADDGAKVGLRHIANIWRGPQIGFGFDSAVYEALKGKTIVRVEILTRDGHYAFDADIGIAEDQRLAALSDTYIELFPEFAKEAYKDYWMECIKAYPVDDASAEDIYATLTNMFLGRLYGQEAVDAYSSDPSGMIFDCFLENGLAKITVNGSVISGADAEGNELFRHAYAYLQDVPVTYFGQEMPAALHVYQTADADAGMFTYFAFSDDTLAETQHIEFRYGETLENMGSYTEGPYAYWLAGAIQDGYSEKLIKACIKLFVDENVGEMFADQAESMDAVAIDSAEKLAAINENPSGNYILTADIDLAGMEWTPIGAFVMGGGEEGEVPDLTAAFTGTFDGQGHTIRNLTINQPEGWALGLFGCAANAEIGNFTLENAAVNGSVMAADVVGYAYCSTVADVKLVNGKVTAHWTEMSAEGMYGGITGACLGSLITDCDAQADITIPDNTANAGVVGGGLQMTSVVNCTATGSVTAGNGCYGIGGISGCGFTSEEFTNLTARDVVITVGDDCRWIGGITGYAGGYPVEELGMTVTVFTNCQALNVAVHAGANADGIGDIVGSGFYSDELAANGAPFDQPTQFELVDCKAEPAIAAKND